MILCNPPPPGLSSEDPPGLDQGFTSQGSQQPPLQRLPYSLRRMELLCFHDRAFSQRLLPASRPPRTMQIPPHGFDFNDGRSRCFSATRTKLPRAHAQHGRLFHRREQPTLFLGQPTVRTSSNNKVALLLLAELDRLVKIRSAIREVNPRRSRRRDPQRF